MKAHHHIAADPCAEAHRHAYNAAFEELNLAWHWDTPTYARLGALGRDGVRSYLESEQAHLLRAYEAEFLVEAVEAAKARCYESIASNPARQAPWARRASAGQDRLAA
ncbi:MAG: hypothetical protein ABI907_03635 [Ramlibacter sp.]